MSDVDAELRRATRLVEEAAEIYRLYPTELNRGILRSQEQTLFEILQGSWYS